MLVSSQENIEINEELEQEIMDDLSDVLELSLDDSSILIVSPQEQGYHKNRVDLEIESEVECDLGYSYMLLDSSDLLMEGYDPLITMDFKRLCKDCESYDRRKSFKNGFYYLTVICLDEPDINSSVFFFVDSKAPKISKTYPKRNSFTNGSDFMMKYTEFFPLGFSLIINDELVFEKDGPFGESNNFCPLGKNQKCNFNMDVSDYEGQEIEYYFGMFDIIPNIVFSKPVLVTVDTTPPVLLNPNKFVWQGEGRKNRYVYFDFEIEEDNLDEITYIDSEDRRPRERKLCSKLKKGSCEKKKSFRKGEHNLTIYIKDKAGNSVEERVVFSVV